MSHYKKLYDKIKNNPKDVKFKDIDILLQKVGGFTRRNPGSDHYTYSHPDLQLILTIPLDRPIKEPYIKAALSAFEEVYQDFNID